MTVLARIVFGSHLYGTETEHSDRDWKAIVLPPAEDILLQRVRNAHRHSTKVNTSYKNTNKDVETETWALHHFFKLLAEGHPGALDTLFAPHWAHNEEKHQLWIEIEQNRHRLISNKSTAFIGCCKQKAAQANEGVDWKAMSHAVRVGHQSLELLRRGRITFPRPEAEHLVEIKTGKLPYAQVAEEIEYLIERIKEVEKVSLLPAEPDLKWMEQKVLEAYEMQVSTSTNLPSGPGKRYQVTVAEMGFPETLCRLLERNKIKTSGDLAWKSTDEVACISGLGPKKYKMISDAMERFGTKIGDLLERQANAPHPGMAPPRGRKRTRPGYRPVYGASKAKLQALHPRTG
jgi:hypothetical protein